MVSRMNLRGHAGLRLLLAVTVTLGCERLAGLSDLENGTPPSTPSSAGGGGEAAAEGGSQVGLQAGNGTVGVNTSGASTGGVTMSQPEPEPDPSDACTLDVSALDDCILE